MPDLRELAERYIALETEIGDVRRAMLATLANGRGPGADESERTARPTQRPAAGAKHLTRAEVMETAAAARERIVETLKARSLSSAELARTLETPPATLMKRLDRLRESGLIARGENGAWMAVAG